jgi:hypothetical protein
MKSRSEILADKSLQVAISAIEIYNKPNFLYREETFAILMINAWELLLKAKMLHESKNKIQTLYVTESNRNFTIIDELYNHNIIDADTVKQIKNYVKIKYKPKKSSKKYKQNRSGKPLTLELSKLLQDLKIKNIIDEVCVDNIYALIEIRDNAIHFLNYDTNIAQIILELGTASLKNFSFYISRWFNKDLSKYNLFLMPISFIDINNIKQNISPKTNSNSFNSFVKYVAGLQNKYAGYDSNNTTFLININFEYKKANSIDAIKVTKSLTGIEISETVEEKMSKYPLRYKELVKKAQERYSNFKVDKDFHTLMNNEIKTNDKIAYTNYLDPLKKTTKITTYSNNVFQCLDTHYIRRVLDTKTD